MEKYSNEEMADMHLVYGAANGNRAEARRLYAERFPNRRLPREKLSQKFHVRLKETGSFKSRTENFGRPRTTRTPALEERVLNTIEETPDLSTRRLALVEGVNHVILWQILRSYQFYPYHLQRAQALNIANFAPRVAFYNWCLQKCANDYYFPSIILFTDEAGFTRDEIFNFHNLHLWHDENPHAVIRLRHQQQLFLNVWSVIIGDTLIGPVVFLDG